jgi:hypothetical protein
MAATDFLTTEVWTSQGLVTYYTQFQVDLKTRRDHRAGSTRNPDEAFMAQIARNLTDAVDGFLLPHRFLICDRDTKFTAQFQEILKDPGIAPVLTPHRAPNCNAYSERFVRTPSTTISSGLTKVSPTSRQGLTKVSATGSSINPDIGRQPGPRFAAPNALVAC